MPLFYLGNPLVAGGTSDFVFDDPTDGTDTTINGGLNNDLLYGDLSTFWSGGATSVLDAVNITAFPNTWSYDENPDILNATTVPHTTIYASAPAASTFWYRVDAVAGNTITLDIDYGGHAIGVGTDTILRIWDSILSTTVASNDDSLASEGGSGSTSSADSFLTYTFTTTGTYYIEVGEFGPLPFFEGGEEFLLHVSMTGQNATGGGGAGADTLDGGFGNDVLYGMGGNDWLDGGGDADITDGGSGNDTVIDGDFINSDIHDGGDGSDWIDYSSVSFNGAVTINIVTGIAAVAGGNQETIRNFENVRGSQGDETIFGSSIGNFLVGNGGQDTIYGLEGGDILYGGTGSDDMYGEEGDDWFYLIVQNEDTTGETYDGGFDYDTLYLANLGSYAYDLRDDNIVSIEAVILENPGSNHAATLRLNASQIGSGVSSAAAITGTSAGDVRDRIEITMAGATVLSLAAMNFTNFNGPQDFVVVYGDGDAETITGSSVVDELWGGGGNDSYYIANGDLVRELVGGGNDTAYVLGSAFTLGAGAEVETLAVATESSTNAVAITGNEFGQQIRGNNGSNTLAGGGGIDSFVGYFGDDIYVVDHAAETITELAGQGSDSVYTTVSYTLAAGVSIERLVAAPLASSNPVNLTGNELGQVIVGNNGVNTINGGAGNDSIYGMGGNDVIEGAQGNDSLFGGTGVDRFIFRESLGAASGIDRIYDLTAADRIRIDATAVTTLTALTASQFRIGTAALDADDRIIYDQATGVFRFDPDGNGAQAAIVFGVVDGAPVISHAYFELA